MNESSPKMLISVGRKLAVQLRTFAADYCERADRHEILIWEAITVTAKADHLETGAGVPEDLYDSTLLSAWGKDLQKELPDLTRRVAEFHRAYESFSTGRES